MIAEAGPTVRWVERDRKMVLQYRVNLVSVSGDMDDEEYMEYIKEHGVWRDVPVVKAGEAEK